jgi:hypothetical protein
VYRDDQKENLLKIFDIKSSVTNGLKIAVGFILMMRSVATTNRLTTV